MKYIILACAALLCCSEAWALRCGGDLVSEGDRKIEVLRACGEPLLVDSWNQETVAFRGNEAVVIGEKNIQSVEVWTYNFGPTRFIQFLRFVNGRLEHISRGPHGFTPGELPAAVTPDCGEQLSVGDHKVEVLLHCGEPAAEDSWKTERFVRQGDRGRAPALGRKVHVRVDEWTYNFGPNRFLLFVTMENGVVVDMETGDYGF